MIFPKLSHNLDQWQELEFDEQEEWGGRDKITGLLLESRKWWYDFKKNELKVTKMPGKLAKLIHGQGDPEVKLYDEWATTSR